MLLKDEIFVIRGAENVHVPRFLIIYYKKENR